LRGYPRHIPYLFLLPALLYFVVFWGYPLFSAVYLSFTSYNFLKSPRWVGVKNYVALFRDGLFYHSLIITVEFAVISQLITMAIGLSLALAVNSKLRGRELFRVILFLPVITSSVAISLMWGYMFDPIYGVLNSVMKALGLPPQQWVHSPSEALASLMIMTIWQWAGYHMFLFLSGLQAIPEEYYHAALIDGANAFRRFFRVTLPLLKPTILFVLVLATIGGLQVFTPVYVLTSGGPVLSTYVLMYYIYQEAFHYLQAGYADAASMIFALIIFAVVGLELWLLRKGGLTYYGQRT